MVVARHNDLGLDERKDVKLKGAHNLANVLAAAALRAGLTGAHCWESRPMRVATAGLEAILTRSPIAMSRKMAPSILWSTVNHQRARVPRSVRLMNIRRPPVVLARHHRVLPRRS